MLVQGMPDDGVLAADVISYSVSAVGWFNDLPFLDGWIFPEDVFLFLGGSRIHYSSIYR